MNNNKKNQEIEQKEKLEDLQRKYVTKMILLEMNKKKGKVITEAKNYETCWRGQNYVR